MSGELEPCIECGMPCETGEYHPYAACLMFKACHNSETVRMNLKFVRNSNLLTTPNTGPLTENMILEKIAEDEQDEQEELCK